MPAFSVVVPHYGEPSLALRLLDTLAPQLGPQDELLVVDDASPTPFPATEGGQCRVIKRSSNGGFGSAVNTGAAAATGTHLLVLNSDLEIDSGFMVAIRRAAVQYPDAVLGPRTTDASGSVEYTARRFHEVRHLVLERLEPLQRSPDLWRRAVGHEARCRLEADFKTDWLVGSALVVPLRRFSEVGGFDERFHMNCEEVDFQRRLKAQGVDRIYLTQPQVRHLKSASSGGEERRLRWLWESRFRYTRKWGGLGGVARLRAGLAAAALLNFAFLAALRALGREVAPLAGLRRDLSLVALR